MAKWIIKRNGKEAGPFETNQLKRLASSGKIKADDQIRRDDQVAWYRAESIKGLFLSKMDSNSSQSGISPESISALQATVDPAAIVMAPPESLAKPCDDPRNMTWFVIRKGKEVGPFSRGQIANFVAAGKLKPDDLVREQEKYSPQKLSELKDLFDSLHTEPSSKISADSVPVVNESVQQNTGEGCATNEAILNQAHAQEEGGEWYRLIDREEVGPIPFVEICDQFKLGEIGTQDFIAQRSMKWIQAGVFLEPKVLENATSEDEWFITSREPIQGPFKFSNLQEMAHNNELAQDTLIGRKGAKGLPLNMLIVAQEISFTKLLSDAGITGERVLVSLLGLMVCLFLWLTGGSAFTILSGSILSIVMVVQRQRISQWLCDLGTSRERTRGGITGFSVFLLFWFLRYSLLTSLLGGAIAFVAVLIFLSWHQLPIANRKQLIAWSCSACALLVMFMWMEPSRYPINRYVARVVSRLKPTPRSIPDDVHYKLLEALNSQKPEPLVAVLKNIPDVNYLFTGKEIAAMKTPIDPSKVEESGYTINHDLVFMSRSTEDDPVLDPRGVFESSTKGSVNNGKVESQLEATKEVEFSKYQPKIVSVIFVMDRYEYDLSFYDDDSGPVWYIECVHDAGFRRMTESEARWQNSFNSALRDYRESAGQSHSITSYDTSHKAGDYVSGRQTQYKIQFYPKTGRYKVER
jgi:hypothetical protein